MWKMLLWGYVVIFAVSILAETSNAASHAGGQCKSAADLKNYPNVSRFNPKTLSARDICWLDVYADKKYGISESGFVWFKTETIAVKNQIKSITYHTISIKELTDGTAPIKEKVSDFVKSCITRADIEAGYKFPEEIALENLAKSTGRRIDEKVSEKVTESVSNRVTEQISNRVSEEISRDVTESVTEEVSRSISESVAESVSRTVTEAVSSAVSSRETTKTSRSSR